MLKLLGIFLSALIAGAGCRPSAETPPTSTPPAAAAMPAWLEDVTGKVGVDFLHEVGPVGTYFMPESLGSGAAIFDFDNDGRMDLLFLQNAGTNSATARHQLFHQESDGHFRNVSAGSGLDLPGRGMGVAVGDVDNDGRPDVLITEHDRVRLFHNLGGGKFGEITDAAGLANPHWGMSAAFFDYDRDGWLDLIVVNYVDYSHSNKCQDAQGKPIFCGPSGFPGTVPRLFRNLGAHGGIRFEDVTLRAGLGKLAAPGLSVVCADVNGDHWPDLFIANDGHVNWLLINQRNGTFTEEGATRGVAYNEMGAVQANMGVALGDADGDGLFDLLVTHLSTETHALWKQGPRGYFQDRTAPARVAASAWRGTGFGTVFTDLNNDGAPDLAVVNGGIKRIPIEPAPQGKANRDPFWNGFEQRNQIFTNDGRGAFTDVSASNPAFSGTAAVSRGLAVGDLDNDGGPDLIVTRIAAPAQVYRNIAPRGHWLTVRTVEPALGGRDAYGAEVTVTAGGRRQTIWVNPSQSYLCSNDPRAHFGLGTTARVESVNVVWPDGSEEQFPGVAADQIITLPKGSGRRVTAAPIPAGDP